MAGVHVWLLLPALKRLLHEGHLLRIRLVDVFLHDVLARVNGRRVPNVGTHEVLSWRGAS